MSITSKDKIEAIIMHLNDLTEINNDRIFGYEKALAYTDDEEMIYIFTNMAALSRSFKSDLINGITLLGGYIQHRAEYTGSYRKAWSALHSGIIEKNRDGIISACEFEEKITLSAYTTILCDKEKVLTDDMKRMILIQKNELEFAYGRILAIRCYKSAY